MDEHTRRMEVVAVATMRDIRAYVHSNLGGVWPRVEYRLGEGLQKDAPGHSMEKQVIFTSHFNNLPRLEAAGLLRSCVPISRTVPSPSKVLNYEQARRLEEVQGRSYRTLAPPRELHQARRANKVSWEQYAAQFWASVLEGIQAADVLRDLMARTGTEDVVLLSWPRSDEQCHRSLVARWLRDAGYDAREWQVGDVSSEQLVQRRLF